MTVYQKNNHWYMEVMVRGIRYHRAIPEARSKKEAEKYVNVFMADLLRGRLDLADNIGNKPFTLATKMYIDYVHTNLKSITSPLYITENFIKLWGNKPISYITPEIIEKYKEMRLHTHTYKKLPNGTNAFVSPATINRELGVLSKIFSIAIDNKLTKINPVAHVKKLRVANKLKKILSKEEEKRIMEVCNGNFSCCKSLTDEELRCLHIQYNKQEYAYKNIKDIILMALSTCMRKGEIFNLKWDCVDFRNNTITVLNPKNGKRHDIYISERLRSILLDKYSKEQGNIYVFTNPNTFTKYNDIKRSFTTICKLAQVEGLRFHDLRHTCATRLIAEGVPIDIVMELMNHSNIQTTMLYTHSNMEQKIKAIENLSKFCA